ncbi:MAG: prepilin-type N-terminal cleavage/methylation domain-containing protein, partial [Peptostreptococcaceae bacterium]|nr:prepilin-type N-terminal cleavage/methylation domain-containing protein [Peptostreptococcaceae bacterium]
MYITKNKRLDGFTLIELLITISMTSVLLIFISQWIIAVPFKTINQVTRDISLQSGVTATGDMVSDIIKKSTQVHLIGSNVFEPSLNLKGKDKTKLDNNYSYIAIKKDTFGNKLLYNITPNNDANGNIINWNEEPIMATNKKSLLKNGQIFSYDLDFYK